MIWLLIITLVWTVLAFRLAVSLGRGIRMADAITGPGSWTEDVERYLRDQATAPLH